MGAYRMQEYVGTYRILWHTRGRKKTKDTALFGHASQSRHGTRLRHEGVYG